MDLGSVFDEGHLRLADLFKRQKEENEEQPFDSHVDPAPSHVGR
jgi:hypothetical protein